ncbi:MAG TPA: metallophosphoesterase [Solirubrobacteraceae bacterium]|nr:metallophosphoesterase [Solirubrobacteraceae bacterium]
MRTLIISDLHLGGLTGIDLLRRPAVREALLRELEDVERLLLLGDVLELRHGPPHEALLAARAFFEDVGQALAGRELVITAGNHDHQLVSAWLDRRAALAPAPLELEQRIAPADASPLLAQIAEWAAPARVEVAYPGLWVRPDVYATHGHFLDCHLTLPTLERIGIGAIGRFLERPESSLASVDDYEAVTSPIYGWRDVMVRYGRAGATLNGVATVRAWRALGGGRGVSGEPAARAAHAGSGGGRAPAGSSGAGDDAAARADMNGDLRRGAASAGAAEVARAVRSAGTAGADRFRASARRWALRRGFMLAVDAINRAGMGPVKADLSRDELRRSGLRAMGEVAARLGLGDAHVVFGHTHRAGPFPRDAQAEWRGRAGARLVNCGSWTLDSIFITAKPGESPYWPGACVLVPDSGPPELKRLLLDRSLAELRPSAA